jgi:hypothetical protein
VSSVLIPLDEVMKGGRLRSSMPRNLRRCVVDVFKKRGIAGREGMSSAFAICTATLQKAGQIKPGTQKTTKKGKKRGKAKGRLKNALSKDVEYEKLLAKARGE